MSVAVNVSHFEQLVNELEYLKVQIKELKEMPGNMGLIDAIKSTDKSSPVLDMFQILSLQKRMDAAESGMNKLASLVEDVVKVVEIEGERGGDLRDRASALKSESNLHEGASSPLESIEKRLVALEARVGLSSEFKLKIFLLVT